MFDYKKEPQLVTKLLLQVSIRELHNRLVSDTNYGNEDDNIIISDSTLRSLLPPKLKRMFAKYKVMCGY